MFKHQYQSMVPIDYIDLPYRDLCAALRFARLAGSNLAAWAEFFHPLNRHNISAQTLRRHDEFFVTQPLSG